MAQAVSSADATEAPLLLSSPTPPPPAGAPRRNWFAFICATLASVTTMLHGYSTYVVAASFYYITKRWYLMLPIPTCFADLTLMSGAELFMREDVGLTDAEVEVLAGVHERLHARVHPRRRLGGGPPGPPPHPRARQRLLSWPARSPCRWAPASPRSWRRASSPASAPGSPASSPPCTTPRYRRRPCAASSHLFLTYVYALTPASSIAGFRSKLSLMWLLCSCRCSSASVYF